MESNLSTSLSIIVCTYNPKELYFSACIQAILDAFIPNLFEIIVVDNNSTVSINSLPFIIAIDTNVYPIRVVRENEQGLTAARLRGIREATGDILIFIDDDNVINPDFFLKVTTIASKYPFIGAFSGQVVIEPEGVPEIWTRKYWGMLVHRTFQGNKWGNTYFHDEITPYGAGLCVRRKVATHYQYLHEQGKRAILLDRRGESLLSGGDNDLAMCAIDMGMGMGLFEELYIKHLIVKDRFSIDYLSRLSYGITFSSVILKHMRNVKYTKLSIKRSLYLKAMGLFKSGNDRRMQNAWIKALQDAHKFVLSDFKLNTEKV